MYFQEVNKHDVIIVGGGLAGLTAALALSLDGHDIAVFETNKYPHHKVCGEYVSNEIVPYLKSLGVDLISNGGVSITEFEISSPKGRKVGTKLPMGGVGISRYTLDNLLYETAKREHVHFYFEKVTDISYENDVFTVTGRERNLKSRVVIGAYGKRSGLDKKLDRSFIRKKTDWLAVKAHYHYPDFPQNLVALHNFNGGYGGLSKTEMGTVNFCYLAQYNKFKEYRNIEDFNSSVVCQNPFLADFFKKCTPAFDAPLSIGQISFDTKKPVVDHILMCGDTAGLIHPLCGNGMAMAIHSGKLVSEVVNSFLLDSTYSRNRMEADYRKLWSHHFKSRLKYGRYFQKILMHGGMLNWGISNFGKYKSLLGYIISKTHGKTVVHD